jgi:hypothetical protein
MENTSFLPKFQYKAEKLDEIAWKIPVFAEISIFS